jgi:hypothetical protein
MNSPFIPPRFSSGFGDEAATFGGKALGTHYTAYLAALAPQRDSMGVLARLLGLWVQRATDGLFNDTEGAFHGV